MQDLCSAPAWGSRNKALASTGSGVFPGPDVPDRKTLNPKPLNPKPRWIVSLWAAVAGDGLESRSSIWMA